MSTRADRLPSRKRRQLEETRQSLDHIATTVTRLHVLVPELAARDAEQVGPDGYPTTASGQGSSTIATRDIRSSTEAAGIHLATQGVEPDAIHLAYERATELIHTSADNLRTALSVIVNALKLGETNRGRQTHLLSCGNPHCTATVTGLGEDRLKRGRCPKCYSYRQRTGHEWTSRVDGAA